MDEYSSQIVCPGASAKRKKRHFPLELPFFLGPITLIVVVFVFAPLAIILTFGFLKSGLYGDIIYSFTLDNYRNILAGSYGEVFIKSFYLAVQTTFFCIILGYPLAYYIARFGGRYKVLLLALIVIPSWTAYLIRIYALKTIVGNSGIINSMLMDMGLISTPVKMLYTQPAVAFGLIYTWLPFMILPLYAALEGLNPSVLEAALDLGANPVRRFFRVTLPMTRGGVLAGSILVLIPTLGDWLVPHLLGGAKVMMIGNMVAEEFIVAGNIPVGSSLAIMLAAILTLILYLLIKWGGKDAMEKIV
jgi:spermidine/putrescine transport system permease protein